MQKESKQTRATHFLKRKEAKSGWNMKIKKMPARGTHCLEKIQVTIR